MAHSLEHDTEYTVVLMAVALKSNDVREYGVPDMMNEFLRSHAIEGHTIKDYTLFGCDYQYNMKTSKRTELSEEYDELEGEPFSSLEPSFSVTVTAK